MAHASAVLGRLHAGVEPVFYLGVIDMHELHADRAAVGLFELFDQMAQALVALGMEIGSGREGEIKVFFA